MLQPPSNWDMLLRCSHGSRSRDWQSQFFLFHTVNFAYAEDLPWLTLHDIGLACEGGVTLRTTSVAPVSLPGDQTTNYACILFVCYLYFCSVQRIGKINNVMFVYLYIHMAVHFRIYLYPYT